MDTEYLKIRTESLKEAVRHAETSERNGRLEDSTPEDRGAENGETIYTIGSKIARAQDLSDEWKRALAADLCHRLETLFPSKAIPIFTQ